jgi:hypothetical protein
MLLETQILPAEVTGGESGRSNLKGKSGSIGFREIFEEFRTSLAVAMAGLDDFQTLPRWEWNSSRMRFKEGQ